MWWESTGEESNLDWGGKQGRLKKGCQMGWWETVTAIHIFKSGPLLVYHQDGGVDKHCACLVSGPHQNYN